MLFDWFIKHHAKGILYVILITFAGFLCFRIAILTPYNAHPDEYTHVDAFKYFETNWWPPDLGSGKLVYSPYGQSHVYTGEIVYFIYGKIGRVINHFLQTDNIHYLVYRFINILLFMVTLSLLFFSPCKSIKTIPIAFVFLCVPQVAYIYSYANYDGWAVSSTVFVFVWAIIMAESASIPWSWSATGILGVFTGFIFASRQPDILGLAIPYFILGVQAVRNAKGNKILTKYAFRLIIALVIGFCLSSPLKLIYRHSQGDFQIAYEQMREEKAQKPFKPSTKSFPFYHLAEKGETYRHMLIDRKWLALSYMSFYGGYGYLNLWNPPWIYWLAGILSIMSVFLTLYTFIRKWININRLVKWSLILSPIIFIINIGASIYHSMHIDFQAQGRYLFCALIPISILFVGTVDFESRKIKIVRVGIFIVLYSLSVFSLFFIAPLATLPR